MKARQARKILRYAKGGPIHKCSRYWFTRLLFYGTKPGRWNDHRITEALKVYQRHGRCKHPLSNCYSRP